MLNFDGGVEAVKLILKFQTSSVSDGTNLYNVCEECVLTGDRRQAKHFYLAKQFCFLDSNCLVVGESQGSSRRSVGKYPVKPPRPEGDSQTIGTYRCRNH